MEIVEAKSGHTVLIELALFARHTKVGRPPHKTLLRHHSNVCYYSWIRRDLTQDNAL